MSLLLTMKNKQPKKKRRNNSPYWFVHLVALIAACAILYAAVKTSVIDAPHWNRKAETMLQLDSIRLAAPQRGNILAHDGTPLAQTVALYTAYVDFKDPVIDTLLYVDIKHPKGSGIPDTLNLDVLCSYLAQEFPVKTKDEYRQYINKKRRQHSNSCVLAENISLEQYEALKNISSFKNKRKGRHTGLTKQRSYKRFYPYDELTSVILGRASQATAEMLANNKSYKRNEWHGTSGLERGLDTLLFGSYGTAQKQQEHWGFGVRVLEPPVEGYDVVTTLDMTIQEIAERNLMHMVRSQRAEYGTAVIMEVATGEIRAIANVEKNKEGKYTFKTRRNYAITAIEPGSVVKTLSMLMAMENGKVDPYREFNSEGAIPEIGGYKAISKYKNPLTVQEVIIRSDNRGICKIVGDVYRGRYNDFVHDIRNSGIMRTMELPLPDAQAPHVQPMAFEKQWQYYAFAQMIFGYHNRFSPITTLSVYNAIANDGKLMQPKLLKSLMRDGKADSIFEPVCLNEHFCTPEHAAQLREMLHGVVNSPIGTARGIQGGRVVIAGKTGTANATIETLSYDADGKKQYGEKYADGLWRLAFAGFFPYENPQYSCIVVVDKPRVNTAWAGGVPGGVFRAIVEEMYNRNLLECNVEYTSVDSLPQPPRNSASHNLDKNIYDYLHQYPAPDTTRVKKAKTDTAVVEAANMPVVPSVVGWSAQEALYELEKLGMEVELQGMGRVERQSLQAGIPLQKGMKIKLILK